MSCYDICQYLEQLLVMMILWVVLVLDDHFVVLFTVIDGVVSEASFSKSYMKKSRCKLSWFYV